MYVNNLLGAGASACARPLVSQYCSNRAHGTWGAYAWRLEAGDEAAFEHGD